MSDVLMFDRVKGIGRIHAAECPMCRTAGTRMVRISDDVAWHAQDLQKRGYTVTRCKCVGAKR